MPPSAAWQKQQAFMKSQWEERMKQQGLAVKAWWEQNEKDESAKLTRGELKAVVEFIEPKAKAAMADDETMDELVMQCEHGLARQTEVVRVMAKARSYLADASYFEGLYRRHDADGNGHLSKSEMLPLLREVASQLPNPPNAPVGEDDVDGLWELCEKAPKDSKGHGKITKTEVVMQIASWRDRMASVDWQASELPNQAKSSACVLL